MNMTANIPGGVWPTMITPFTDAGEIDDAALERLIDWYIAHGVSGLFAVCQSSEMFFLSLEERTRLAAFVKAKAAGRVPVIASGHISDGLDAQVMELRRMAETGVDALVLITNRLARADEPDDVWRRNMAPLMSELPPDVPLGLYECPYPYKRLLSPELLAWAAQTGRFLFLKDTSCDADQIKAKLNAVRHTPLRIYNANSATLLHTLKMGVHGYSGVMANFHPSLYVRLAECWASRPADAEALADMLSMMSLIEKQLYPVNAKYYLMLEGVLDSVASRAQDHRQLTATHRMEVEQLRRISDRMMRAFPT
jgi:4-hydroxy-tetrahydrodipicolinate synthase